VPLRSELTSAVCPLLAQSRQSLKKTVITRMMTHGDAAAIRYKVSLLPLLDHDSSGRFGRMPIMEMGDLTCPRYAWWPCFFSSK
jgi:hypothetical protein